MSNRLNLAMLKRRTVHARKLKRIQRRAKIRATVQELPKPKWWEFWI